MLLRLFKHNHVNNTTSMVSGTAKISMLRVRLSKETEESDGSLKPWFSYLLPSDLGYIIMGFIFFICKMGIILPHEIVVRMK